MMKRCSLAIILLFLVPIMVACGKFASSITYYNIIDGKKVECSLQQQAGDPQKGGPCDWPFYEVDNLYDGTIEVSECDSFQGPCHAITPTASVATPTQCTPNYVYNNLTNEGQSMIVLSRQQDTNNSTSAIQVSFAATTTKTVTVTDEEQLTASLSVGVDVVATITASVQAQINHSVSQSVTIGISNSPTLSIPPGKTGYANYGVSVQITSGHLYDKAKCEGGKSDAGTDITYVPIAAGWCLWTGDQSPSLCPSI